MEKNKGIHTLVGISIWTINIFNIFVCNSLFTESEIV